MPVPLTASTGTAGVAATGGTDDEPPDGRRNRLQLRAVDLQLLDVLPRAGRNFVLFL